MFKGAKVCYFVAESSLLTRFFRNLKGNDNYMEALVELIAGMIEFVITRFTEKD